MTKTLSASNPSLAHLIRTPRFMWLVLLMALSVLSSNILVQYAINYTLEGFGFKLDLALFLTYGAFTYPAAFMLNDSTNYLYGPKGARYVVVVGFAIGLLTNLLLYFYDESLMSLRIVLASGAAFIVSQFLEIAWFSKLRLRAWYTRPVFTTLMSGLVDSFIFFNLAFYGTGLPVATMTLGDYTVKALMSVVMVLPYWGLIRGKLIQDRLAQTRSTQA